MKGGSAMRFTGLLILGVACLVASGCASQVHVTSDPSGAAITINGSIPADHMNPGLTG